MILDKPTIFLLYMINYSLTKLVLSRRPDFSLFFFFFFFCIFIDLDFVPAYKFAKEKTLHCFRIYLNNYSPSDSVVRYVFSLPLSRKLAPSCQPIISKLKRHTFACAPGILPRLSPFSNTNHSSHERPQSYLQL